MSLLLEVESESKARVLGKRVKHYLVGQEFEAVYKLTNTGNQNFPGGTFSVVIHWPNGQYESTTYTIPPLIPKETRAAVPKSKWGVLSRGFALFYLTDAKDNTGKSISINKSAHNPIPKTVSFYSVLGKEPEELYQYWALIVALVALLILVGEKVLEMLLWIIN
jgi:hypothetical protein